MEIEPWNECPQVGAYHRYMGRMADSRRASGYNHGNWLTWPASGYVSAPNWEGDEFDPNAPEAKHGGLWGYLNCIGDWLEPYKYGYQKGGTVQILVVDTREVCFHIDETCRAPRAWIKYSGTLERVVAALNGEKSPYGEACAAYMTDGLSRGRELWFRMEARIQRSAAAMIEKETAVKWGGRGGGSKELYRLIGMSK